jgi:hypothetical protein
MSIPCPQHGNRSTEAVAREFGDPIPEPKGRKLMYA